MTWISKGGFGLMALGAAGAAAGLVLVLAATAGGAGAQDAPEKPRRACVDVSRTLSRQVIAPDKLRVEDQSGRTAILTLSAPCKYMDDLDQIGFEIFGTGYLCQPNDVRILHSRNGEKPLTCLIQTVKVMSRDETREYDKSESSKGA